MSSTLIPLFKDIWFRARRNRTVIIAEVLMADDSIATIRFGPRGGWWIIKR